MFNRIFIILIGITFVLGMGKLSFAMMCGSHAQHSKTSQAEHAGHETISTETAKSEAINVGNKICPVSGEKIEEKTKATYEYEGKVYNFCCTSCIDEFKKDPEKYIKKIEDELRAKSKEESRHEKEGMEMMQESGTSHQ